MAISEKQLTNNIANAVAKSIVDECGGITLSGEQIADKYAERCYENGGEEIMAICFRAMAITHWVCCAGYNKNTFKIVMNKSIKNC